MRGYVRPGCKYLTQGRDSVDAGVPRHLGRTYSVS